MANVRVENSVKFLHNRSRTIKIIFLCVVDEVLLLSAVLAAYMLRSSDIVLPPYDIVGFLILGPILVAYPVVPGSSKYGMAT
jgi:hypothetical protein